MKKKSGKQLNIKNTQECQSRIESQLARICNNVLELRTWHQDMHHGLGWIACWFFIPFAVPLVSGFAYSEWRDMEEYGYDFLGVFGSFIMLPLIFFSFTLGYGISNMRLLKKHSYLRLNRDQQFVYALMNNQVYGSAWADVKVKFTTNMGIYGDIAEFREVICFTLPPLDTRAKNKKSVKVSVLENADVREDESLNDSSKQVWEYIRQFMEDGPSELSVPRESSSPGEYSYISLSPGLAWLKHRPLPVFRLGANGLFQWILFPIVFIWKVVFLIPNLIAEWIWHGIFKVVPGPKVKFPEESFAGCENCISSMMLEKVLKPNELELEYKEATKRLGLY